MEAVRVRMIRIEAALLRTAAYLAYEVLASDLGREPGSPGIPHFHADLDPSAEIWAGEGHDGVEAVVVPPEEVCAAQLLRSYPVLRKECRQNGTRVLLLQWL